MKSTNFKKLEEMSAYIDVSSYDEHEEKHAYFIDMMQSMIDIFMKKNRKNKHCRVLELGAGTGIFTKRLATIPHIELTAVELDENCFNILQKKLQKFQFINLVNGDSCTYHQPDVKFDYIFSSFSDHHIKPKEKHKYFQNIKRNLQPGGLFIVGDEFLPPHDPNNQAEWKNALNTYHNHIISIAQSQGEKTLANLEREALKSGLEKNGDFKISCSQYEEFLLNANLKFTSNKIGPLSRDDVGGVYVYQIAS